MYHFVIYFGIGRFQLNIFIYKCYNMHYLQHIYLLFEMHMARNGYPEWIYYC